MANRKDQVIEQSASNFATDNHWREVATKYWQQVQDNKNHLRWMYHRGMGANRYKAPQGRMHVQLAYFCGFFKPLH